MAPRGERTLFTNRDKFDLVVIYDESSEAYTPESAVTSLSKAIYEQAFKKTLRHTPMLLVGGIQAWKDHFGGAEVVRGGLDAADGDPSALPRLTSPSTYSRSRSGTIPPVNGDSVSFNAAPLPSLDILAGPSR